MDNGNSSLHNEAYGGFDSSRVIRPQENHWQKGNESADYQASVDRVTPWNADNFQGAYDAAAKKGSSVTFVVGSQNTKDIQNTLKNMEALKKQNPDTQIVYLDKDKMANDPRYADLRDWVQKNTGGTDCAFMAQYGVRPGKEGRPEGGSLVSSHWGSDTSSLQQQLQFGNSFTKRSEGQFKIPEGSDIKPAPGYEQPNKNFKDSIAKADVIAETGVKEMMDAWKNANDKAEAFMKVAKDSGKPEAIAQAQESLNRLAESRKELQRKHDGPAETRKEYAKQLMQQSKALRGDGKDRAKVAQADELAAQAGAQLNDAVAKVPDYFKGEAGEGRKKELRDMGISEGAINRLAEGKLPADDHRDKDHPNVFMLSKAQREAMYSTIKSPFTPSKEVLDNQRAIIEAGIKEAQEKGLPLVVKNGMKHCDACEKMDDNTVRPLGDSLKGKAVVISVDGPGSVETLREHGFNANPNTTYPNAQVFDVSKSGNLKLKHDLPYQTVDTHEHAIQNVNAAVGAVHAERAAATAQAQRAEMEIRHRAEVEAQQRVFQEREREETRKKAWEQQQRFLPLLNLEENGKPYGKPYGMQYSRYA